MPESNFPGVRKFRKVTFASWRKVEKSQKVTFASCRKVEKSQKVTFASCRKVGKSQKVTCKSWLPEGLNFSRVVAFYIGFSGWSVYQKLDFFLKINISLHNCASKKIRSIRYDASLYLLSWKSREHLYVRPQKSTRSPPLKATDFFGCFFVFCTDVSWTSKIKDID